MAEQLSARHGQTSKAAVLWKRAALGMVLVLIAVLDFARLDREGYSNAYYAAAVKSMLQSWHNFFFVSFDPGGFVTIDKPPLGFWIEALSAKLFGFSGLSLLLPQALAGVLSVAVLYHLVARSFGVPAGLIAALTLAVTPISVVTNRTINIDSQLVLVVLLAAWAALKATESGRLRWLLLCAALLGLGFNFKMMQAYLVLPACGLLYVLAVAQPWKTRLAHLALAALLLVVVSFAWITAVDLTPASQRPYVASSCNNSELNLALGYNGLGRLSRGLFSGCAASSASASGAFTAGETGSAGPLRLLNDELGSQIGWLLALAVIGLLVAAAQRGFPPPFERARLRLALTSRQQSLVLWGMWLVTQVVFFSMAALFHTYYLVMLAPAIAALSGIGAVALWQEYRRADWRRWLLPLALVAMAAVQADLLRPFPDWSRWLTPLIVGVCLAVAALLIAAGLHSQAGMRIGVVLAGAALGLLALLTAPATWAAYSVGHVAGTPPHAGPAAKRSTSGSGGSFPGMGGGGAGPGKQGDAGLLSYLEKHQGSAKYLVATPSSLSAALFILTTGKPVMALGGFTGSDWILTPAQLASMVKRDTVRYFLLAGAAGTGMTLPGAMSPFAGFFGMKKTDLDDWVTKHCAAVPSSVYQAASGAASPGAGQAFSPFTANQLYDCASDPARHPAQARSASPVPPSVAEQAQPDQSLPDQCGPRRGLQPAVRQGLKVSFVPDLIGTMIGPFVPTTCSVRKCPPQRRCALLSSHRPAARGVGRRCEPVVPGRCAFRDCLPHGVVIVAG